ncbi:hypothetical protein [Amycolatopsis panacis]|uniref:hypothetical protein n=1 Tax=Amycolatopsis panacis TaxID=2340917 RepID=UPI0018F7532C|nr:hypothetical protein [Amycolatopsis panacis]
MNQAQMMPMSELSQDLYGLSAATEEAFLNYGKALLVIAGADGEVGEAEFAWLVRHRRKMGVPEHVIDKYREFDYRAADLTTLHAPVDVERAVNDLRAALFHVSSLRAEV